MTYLESTIRPSKEEQKLALESYGLLADVLGSVKNDSPEIEIEETQEKIRVPVKALRLLAKILKETSRGKAVSIVPVATELTTQAAADILGCSRPHLVKLLEKGEIEFTKIGRHRRIKFEDVMAYKQKIKTKQRDMLIKIMHADEESGLYDS
ncbi:MAG: helix-turn-helix domain-containing protein [Bacteroidota bacterium]